MSGWILSHQLDLAVGAVLLFLVAVCLRHILRGMRKSACGSCASCSGGSCACGKHTPSCHCGENKQKQDRTAKLSRKNECDKEVDCQPAIRKPNARRCTGKRTPGKAEMFSRAFFCFKHA